MSSEKRMSWTIGGAHMDFREPVSFEEAKELAEHMRAMWAHRNQVAQPPEAE